MTPLPVVDPDIFQRGGVNILEVDGYGVATIKQMFNVSRIAH